MQQIAASLEDKMTIKMNQMMNQMKALVVTTPAPVKAVEEVCVTCGSNHHFNLCPLTRSGNDFPIFHDNIQQFQQTVAVGFIPKSSVQLLKLLTVRIVYLLAVNPSVRRLTSVRCRADTSLFVFTKDSCIMYLLVYVDDLILTGNNESLLTSFTTRLNQEFAIKDLGDLSYFLGLEVSYTNDGLFLSQAKYATDVLTRAALLDSKPVSTPLAANEVFVTEYCCQYAIISGYPKIFHASGFMSQLSDLFVAHDDGGDHADDSCDKMDDDNDGSETKSSSRKNLDLNLSRGTQMALQGMEGTFKMALNFSEDYPNKPPVVRFVSPMFHPNIYADGSICFDILQNQWKLVYDVAAILISVQVSSIDGCTLTSSLRQFIAICTAVFIDSYAKVPLIELPPDDFTRGKDFTMGWTGSANKSVSFVLLLVKELPGD
ncbi:uncharacterized mitochondrial protein-like protein [Tanacetum coccineum]